MGEAVGLGHRQASGQVAAANSVSDSSAARTTAGPVKSAIARPFVSSGRGGDNLQADRGAEHHDVDQPGHRVGLVFAATPVLARGAGPSYSPPLVSA